MYDSDSLLFDPAVDSPFVDSRVPAAVYGKLLRVSETIAAGNYKSFGMYLL